MSIIIKSGSSGNLMDVLADKSIPVTIQNSGVPISGSVSINNFPATQPVSGAISFVSPQHVIVDSSSSIAVTGTFFQATQPVSVASLPLPSGASTASNQATEIASLASIDSKTPTLVSGRQPVDGSGVTQPVSGTVTISGSVAITGAISFTVPQHVIVDSASTIAVTGIFFQATQPVSAASLPLPTNAAQETGGNLASIATAMTSGAAKTQTVSSTGTIQDVTAKGVQGANFAAVQQARDSGRVIRTFTASFTAATTEALVSLTPNTDGTTGTAGTSFTVTSGKKFRIQALFLTCFNVTAAIHACQVNLRMSATGAVTTASPIIGTVATSTAAATIDLATSQAQALPDEIELSGTMQFGVSQIGIALAGQTVVLVGYEF